MVFFVETQKTIDVMTVNEIFSNKEALPNSKIYCKDLVIKLCVAHTHIRTCKYINGHPDQAILFYPRMP